MAVLAICFASCDKKQTSFDLSDIQTTARVQGTIMCYYGQDHKVVDGVNNYIYNMQPAAGRRVYAEVQNSEYNAGSEGVTIFETTTDSVGAYCIDITVPTEGANVTIKADPFVAKYRKVVDVNDNNPVYEEVDYVFEVADKQINLGPNGIALHDTKYEYEGRDLNDEYKYNSKFIVKVQIPEYSEGQEADASGVLKAVVKKNYVSKEDIDVIATINNVCYGATTNGKGEATFIIPTDKENWNANVKIETKAYVDRFLYITQKKEAVINPLTGQPMKDEYGNIVYNTIYSKNYIESGLMEYYYQNRENISFTNIVGDRTPVIEAKLQFTPHSDVENYGYNANKYVDFPNLGAGNNNEGGDEWGDNNEGGDEWGDNNEGGDEWGDNNEGGDEWGDNNEGGDDYEGGEDLWGDNSDDLWE